MKKYQYEIRQVDAMNDGEGWYYNETFKIGEFKTSAADHKTAFSKALRKIGIVCKRGKCRIDFDGDIYEVVERKTNMPLFAAIPQF